MTWREDWKTGNSRVLICSQKNLTELENPQQPQLICGQLASTVALHLQQSEAVSQAWSQ